MNEMSMPKASGLDRIMATMGAYDSEFGGTYANHAPMVLVALDRLGGSESRLYDFFSFYRDFKQLRPFMPAVAPIDAGNWRNALSQREREADLRLFFTGEVERLGITGALETYLPHLAAGVGASALHALMRTAYGLMRQDETEIAAALAYWTATYLPLPPATGAAPVTDDPLEVLRRVYAIGALRNLPLHEMLWHNIRETARQPDFAPVVDWLQITPETPRKLAAASLAVFAATMDFCALHAVTGMHWIRITLPYCPTPEVLLRSFWQCVVALSGEMRFPPLPSADELESWRQLPAPDWPDIKRAAAASNDEHDLSLVFSASEEEKVYGDPLYRWVAARRVKLID